MWGESGGGTSISCCSAPLLSARRWRRIDGEAASAATATAIEPDDDDEEDDEAGEGNALVSDAGGEVAKAGKGSGSMCGGSEGDDGGGSGGREGAGGSDALLPSSPRLRTFFDASFADKDDVSGGGGVEDDDVSVTAPSRPPLCGPCQMVFHVSSAFSVRLTASSSLS